MIFASSEWLYALLLLPVFWLVLRRLGKTGTTSTAGLSARLGSRLIMYGPAVLMSLGFIALVVALARPQEVYYESDVTVKARDIVIAVDKSGSMNAGIPGPLPKSVVGETDLDRDWPGMPPKPGDDKKKKAEDPYESHSRLQVAQAAVLDFVRNRYQVKAGDRIGVLLFDTDQYWSWPLTSDLKMIYRKVRFAEEGTGGGTNFGNMPPGPIDEAVKHFDELGKAQSRVVIMVTDGEDYLSTAAWDRISKQIAAYNIRLYVIGVGETMARSDPDIARLARSVGGQAFGATSSTDMQKIFQEIDKLERSSINTYGAQKRKELYFPFALAALALLFLAGCIQALILNE